METKQFFISGHVVFYENKFPYSANIEEGRIDLNEMRSENVLQTVSGSSNTSNESGVSFDNFVSSDMDTRKDDFVSSDMNTQKKGSKEPTSTQNMSETFVSSDTIFQTISGVTREPTPAGSRTVTAPAGSRTVTAPAGSRTVTAPAGSRTVTAPAGSRTVTAPAGSLTN